MTVAVKIAQNGDYNRKKQPGNKAEPERVVARKPVLGGFCRTAQVGVTMLAANRRDTDRLLAVRAAFGFLDQRHTGRLYALPTDREQLKSVSTARAASDEIPDGA